MLFKTKKLVVKHGNLVSIVIAFLNPGSWLNEAIESVINQTYTNWQLILVDDGSADEDSDIAISYSKTYPGKITYIEHCNHVNKGLTASRNVGAAQAIGEYIAFLDADDCWLPEKLENQLYILNANPQADMLCEASWFWYSWADDNEKNYMQKIGVPQGLYYPPQLMKALYPLGEGAPPCPSGIIIKRQALLNINGFEERFSGVYQLYEDQAFLSKVYAKCIVFVSEQANNLYRKREGSMSSAAHNETIYNEVRLFYLKWLEEYFSSSTNNLLIKKLISNFRSKLETQTKVIANASNFL